MTTVFDLASNLRLAADHLQDAIEIYDGWDNLPIPEHIQVDRENLETARQIIDELLNKAADTVREACTKPDDTIG